MLGFQLAGKCHARIRCRPLTGCHTRFDSHISFSLVQIEAVFCLSPNLLCISSQTCVMWRHCNSWQFSRGDLWRHYSSGQFSRGVCVEDAGHPPGRGVSYKNVLSDLYVQPIEFLLSSIEHLNTIPSFVPKTLLPHLSP